MTRFFGGMGGKGSSSRFGSNQGEKKVDSLALAKEMLAARSKGGKKSTEMSSEERYQKLMAQKMESHKQQLMQQKKYAHKLPGTAPDNQEMSKSTKMALEIIAERMAKKEMKKKKPDGIEIKPTHIGGMYSGYIDAKGNVWNAQQQKVLKIDPKTGDIKTNGLFGRTIGKFDPKSGTSFFKIQKQLEAFAVKNGNGANNIWGQKTGDKPATTNIYGSNGWSGGGNDGGNNNGWW